MSAAGGFIADEMNFAPGQGDPRRVPVLHTTHELLPLLGIAPIAGRTFSTQDDMPGGPDVALISDAFWQREFGRDPSALGRTIRLDDAMWTVVGVMPPDADFGVLQILSSAAYARRSRIAESGPRWTSGCLSRPMPHRCPARRIRCSWSAGWPTAPRSARLNRNRRNRSGPREGVCRQRRARREHRSLEFGDLRSGPAGLFVLVATVALVLIVACVNVANLLLARGDTRAHEVAVRRALGASGSTLLRLFVTESLVLTATASALGIGLAFLGVRVVVSLAPADVPRLDAARVDTLVLAATAGVTVIVAFLFGIIPALQLRRTQVQDDLRDSTTRTSMSRESGRLQQALVVAQLALALLLVCGAGLLLKSFWNLQAVDPGFQAHGVLKAEYQLPAARYPVDFRKWPDFASSMRSTAPCSRARRLCQASRRLPSLATIRWIPVSRTRSRSWGARRNHGRGRRSRSGG